MKQPNSILKSEINKKYIKKKVTFKDDYDNKYFIALTTVVIICLIYSIYIYVKPSHLEKNTNKNIINIISVIMLKLRMIFIG